MPQQQWNHQTWTSKHVTPLGFGTAKTLTKTKARLWLDSKLRLENISKRIKNISRTFKYNRRHHKRKTITKKTTAEKSYQVGLKIWFE